MAELVTIPLKQAPRQMPPLVSVVRIAVSAIYDQSVGPDAGKRIG